MPTTLDSADLCARIEALVQEHIAASHKAAMEALQRAFSSAPSPPPERPRRARAVAQYRDKETLVKLQDAIYERLKYSPGLGAAELSGQLGIDTKALSGPMAKLKKSGLIRSVGQRNGTRYFPIAEKTALTA